MGGAAAASSSKRQRKIKESRGRHQSQSALQNTAPRRSYKQIDRSDGPLHNSDTRITTGMPSPKLDHSIRSNPELCLGGHSSNSIFMENDSSGLEQEGSIDALTQLNYNQSLQDDDGNFNDNRRNNNSGRIMESSPTNVALAASSKQQHHKLLPTFLHPLNDARRFMGKIINDTRVQNTILLLIIVNAIMMGIATFPAIKTNPNIISKFEIVDQVFLIIFTVESGMQLLYHGWTLFKDGFLVFDLLIVVMSWALEGAQVFRAFRIFRAMRLITRVATLKNLVLALFSVVPKMTAIFMLLALIFYIFAVMFTQLFKGMYDAGEVSDPYFDSLPNSFFTLFQMMTLDNWADICFEIQLYSPWAWVPFVAFIIITGFVVVNLIIAVICDAVHVLGAESKAGLEGYTEETFPGNGEGDGRQWLKGVESKSEESMNNKETPYTREDRLRDLELKLDEMVLIQEHMRKTIEVLINTLQESGDPPAEKIRRHSVEEISNSLCIPF